LTDRNAPTCEAFGFETKGLLNEAGIHEIVINTVPQKFRITGNKPEWTTAFVLKK
jgi:hypothetical protein